MKEIDIAIVGGGLAGLTAAIHLAGTGLEVCVFEKENYPHHKVCGEYLSREVIPYLESLEVNLYSYNPMNIGTLIYSNPSGKSIKTTLPQGGIGISRFLLDDILYRKAIQKGAQVITGTVNNIEFIDNKFQVSTPDGTKISAKIVLGAYGKRSLIDKKLDRDFIDKKTSWLAVKGHYKMEKYPENIVSLHNFNGGYCGLSKTETGVVNVCYLATYKSFKKHKDPKAYKSNVLSGNPHLNEFFKTATPLFEKDLSIAQISFEKKSRIQDHIIMLGDAAGLIHPLCGNGMAMAIHSAKLAAESILKHFKPSNFNREAMEKEYINKWDDAFSGRLETGRLLQKVLMHSSLAEISRHTLNIFPDLLPHIIKKTHGNPVL
ncbi:NAD(P)/FAD-dependent oxidoreductase [Antarcticibacterium arcticum]|uniref:NAD(P)/FAD-dependent oxidoreductase n=1 Tax=Antarcticibacterium arcticum TaxID=2585771 RepID=A0A5B8YMA5_9FLAO|nr:NAD(P)/FAD-dependent oxidoreductase [Antarcticibacterium arcticum]